MNHIKFRGAALAVFCSGLIVAPAHAQTFMGIFQGMTNVMTQVTGKVGGKLMGADKPQDIQDARDKFMSDMDQKAGGFPPEVREQLVATTMQQWPMAETAILMSNAQALRAKNAPLLDLSQVAGATMGGAVLGANLGNIPSGGGVLDTIRGGAMDGLISGVSGRPSMAGTVPVSLGQFGNSMGAAMSTNLGAAVTGSVAGGVANGVSSSISSTVGGFFGKLGGRSAQSSESVPLTEETNPTLFHGAPPGQLLAKNLYRENGFLGYRRIEQDLKAGAEAYAPITPNSTVQASIYNYDPSTGTMKAAFRVLKLQRTDFPDLVKAVSATVGTEPRFVVAGSTWRALWANGTFVTSEDSRVTAGWSALAPDAYAAASSTAVK